MREQLNLILRFVIMARSAKGFRTRQDPNLHIFPFANFVEAVSLFSVAGCFVAAFFTSMCFN